MASVTKGKSSKGKHFVSINGNKQYYDSYSEATAAYNDARQAESSGSFSGGSSSGGGGGGGSTPTNGMQDGKYYLDGKQVSVVDYAKAQDFYDPNTKAPTAERLDEIASQDFVTPENKAAYETTKLNPVNQNYLAETYNAQLPKTTVSTNAGDLTNNFQATNFPSVDSTEGNISNAVAGVTGLDYFNNWTQDFYAKQAEREMAQQAENKNMLQSFMSSLTSPSEARKQAQEETGIDVQEYFAKQEAGIKEIESLTNEYNAVKAAKDQQIAATQDRYGTVDFANNRTAQIERNAAPKLNQLSADINAKAAVLEAQQGNFAEAQKYVNQAVADATAETKFNYDMFSLAYEFNQDAFDRVEDIYANAFTAQMTVAQMAYEEQRADKEAIGALLLEYPTAGIDIYNDTLEEAYRKAGTIVPTGKAPSLTADQKNYEYYVAQERANGREPMSFGDWSGADGGGTSVPAYAGAIEQALLTGGTPESAARAAALISENDGIPVNQETLTSWIKWAQNKVDSPEWQKRIFQSEVIASSEFGGATISAPESDTFWGVLFGDN